MAPGSNQFLHEADKALRDTAQARRRDLLARTAPAIRQAAVDEFDNFASTRAHLKAIRQHTLDNLAHYLAGYEERATANGNQVHYARDSAELNSIVLDLCQQHGARRVAKGKSMVTEETGLNDFLQRGGMEVIETDLGEYILQQAGDTPSHIVMPALHKSAEEVRDLFLDQHALGERDLELASDLVREARDVLRPRFEEAEVGIIGANALIAENGYSMLVTNEGNGDLCANLPPVLIVCTTIDRVLPRAQDASALLRLLVRSATGQAQTCYTSFYSGPRRPNDTDGPLATHIILLDNARSEVLDSDYREILECMRCGACLSHCPVYTSVGGHAFGSVYPGPMGSVLTPLLTPGENSAALPNACTSCGRCEEVCPADIALPDLLRDLRAEQYDSGVTPQRWRLGLRLHGWLAQHPRLYRRLTGVVIALLHGLGRRRGHFRRLPFATGWTRQRDFPTPEKGTFMQQYQQRQQRVS